MVITNVIRQRIFLILFSTLLNELNSEYLRLPVMVM